MLLAGVARAATAPPPVARVETSEPVAALTFDACATKGQANGFDQAVFEILEREQVPATVFLSGRWIETHPDAARALAADPLIEIGNHTWDHPHLSRLSPERIGDEIDRTDAAISALGRTPVALRPPFGEWSREVVRVAETRSLPVVLWDVVSGDVDGIVPAARIVSTVTTAVRPGSIVIFHINGRGRFTKDALPAIIANLRDRGFRFVTLSQLLALPDAHLVAAPGHAPIAARHHASAPRPAADVGTAGARH